MRSREVIEPKRKRAALTTLAVLAAFAGLAVLDLLLSGTLGSATAQPRGAADDASWTATTRAADVIAARKALMLEAGLVMVPVDAFAVADPPTEADAQTAAELQRAAASVERLLLALPHLFPPPTNLFDADDELTATAALPVIWEDFARFYAANEAAIRAARALAAATGTDELRAAGAALRSACDGCHAAYMQAYAPPTVTDADRDIDFDFDF